MRTHQAEKGEARRPRPRRRLRRRAIFIICIFKLYLQNKKIDMSLLWDVLDNVYFDLY